MRRSERCGKGPTNTPKVKEKGQSHRYVNMITCPVCYVQSLPKVLGTLIQQSTFHDDTAFLAVYNKG